MGLYQIDPNVGLKNRVSALALQETERRLSLDNRSRAYIAAKKKLKPATLKEDNQLRAYYGLDPVITGGGPASEFKFVGARGGRRQLVRYANPQPKRDSLAVNDISMANPTLDLIKSEARREKTIQSEQGLAGELGINLPKTVRYEGANVRLQPRSNLGIGVRRQLIRRDTPYTNSNGKTVSRVIRPSNVNGEAPITQPERVFALANLDQQYRKLKADSREHKATAKKVKAYLKYIIAYNRKIVGPRSADVVDTAGEIMAHIHKIYPKFDLYSPDIVKAVEAAVTPGAIDTTSAGYGETVRANREAYRTKEAKAASLPVVGIDKSGIKVYGKPTATANPITRMVGNKLYEFDRKTGKWAVVIKGAGAAKKYFINFPASADRGNGLLGRAPTQQTWNAMTKIKSMDDLKQLIADHAQGINGTAKVNAAYIVNWFKNNNPGYFK